MLYMIAEENESGTVHGEIKDTTDSLSQMRLNREENVAFRRRSRCPKLSVSKIDIGKFLANATQEDKKSNTDITYPEYDDSDSESEVENVAPINLSGAHEEVLDLSAVNKAYTMPMFDNQYQPSRLTPLKPLNGSEIKINPNRGFCQPMGKDAKKALFNSKEFYYERENVNHKHVSWDEQKKDVAFHQCQSTREYGHSLSNGYYSQPFLETPSKAVQYQPIENRQIEHQAEVFAVPEPPQKYKPLNKEIIVNGKPYQILALLGKGGSSKVHLVLAKDNSLLAIKCVNLSNVDEKTKMDHLNEIEHLMKMQYCKHIIKIIDHQYIPSKNLLYAVMERGDTDLSRLLKERMTSGEGVPPEMILFYWSEMLLAVKSIHDNNIIHRDLKPANFLLVSGRLKLIDFGIASAIQSEQTSVFKDSQSGTPNYMSPEAWEDLGVGDQRVVRIGRKTDVWSLGCILYTFLYGKTPFQEFPHPMAKFRAITNPNHKIPFPKVKGVPDMLIESCRRCLIYNKDKRASTDELLELKSQILLTPPEILSKLRPILTEEMLERARKAIITTQEVEKT